MTVSSSAELCYVPPHRVMDVWPLCRELIDEALDRATDNERASGWNSETVRQRLLLETMQMWIALRGTGVYAIAITELVRTESGTIAAIPIVVGTDMPTWLHFIKEIETWARHCRAHWLQGQGRTGWARVLAPYGWDIVRRRPDGVMEFRKALRYGQ